MTLNQKKKKRNRTLDPLDPYLQNKFKIEKKKNNDTGSKKKKLHHTCKMLVMRLVCVCINIIFICCLYMECL